MSMFAQFMYKLYIKSLLIYLKMQSKDKQKQEPTIPLLYSKLQKFAQLASDTSQSQAIKNLGIEELIKKLQKKFQDLLNFERPEQGQMIAQKQQLKNDELTFKNIIDLLCTQVLEKDKSICLQWLASIVKISTNTNYKKQESVYELAKQAEESSVIALPYQPAPSTTVVVAASDDISQQKQGFDTKAYFKQDQALITKYFQGLFRVIKRDDISAYATKIVQYICINLLEPFQKQSADKHSLQTYIRFVQLIDSIAAPIYTYYLVTCFRQIVEKICLFMQNAKISTSINSEKINKLIYSLSSITSRWEGSVYYNRVWQWDIKSKTIIALLNSNVSQTKLTGVKLLCQFLRKVQYSSFKPQQLQKYINDNNILQLVFSPDNHPEIISKGKQIYQFLCKYNILDEKQIDILLNLIDKTHQNVCKSVYLTIQSLGQKNLQVYFSKIIESIKKLPRASFYTDQTLQLMQTLMVVAPIQQIKNNMNSIYDIIRKHYSKLKKHLRQKLIRLYFEMFIVGVEEGVFTQNDKITVVDPIGQNLGTNFSALMLDTFIRVIKAQNGKKIQAQCKQILKQSIVALFKQFKIHRKLNDITEDPKKISTKITKNNYKDILTNNPSFYSKTVHLALIKYLLQCYEGDQLPLSYQQLCQLIQLDVSFTKFIQFYDKDQQIRAIETMLSYSNKDTEHISNIAQVYSLIHSQHKQDVFMKIQSWFIATEDLDEKIKLGQFIIKNSADFITVEHILSRIQNISQAVPVAQRKLFSYFILLKNIIDKYDKKGFGKHLPFSYSSNCFDITIKVTNSTDVLKPTTYQIKSQSYQTLAQVIFKILEHDKLIMSSVNFKVNDKYMSITDLTLKIGQIAKKSNNPDNQNQYVVSICVFQVYENQWFDKSQLINDRILNDQIIIALSQIFTKYTLGGKMFRTDCAKLFEMATQTQKISPNDLRIQHLYTYFSQNSEYITLQQWLNFYQKSSEDNPGVVIDNLRKLGYGHLFKDQKDLLKEYKRSQSNQARQIVFEKGYSTYEALFGQYSQAKINQYCFQLLQLLPINSNYVNVVKSKSDLANQNAMQDQKKQQQEKPKVEPSNNQMKEEGVESKQQKKTQIISVNQQFLVQKLLQISKNTRAKQAWYVLALFKELQNKDNKIKRNINVQQLTEKVIQNVSTFLSELLTKFLSQQDLQIDQVDIQILNILTLIVQKFGRQKGQQKKIPKTLINGNKNKQMTIDIQDELQDPLAVKQFQKDNKVGGLPSFKFTQISKLATKLLSFLQKKGNSGKFQKIVQVIDKLLLIDLFNFAYPAKMEIKVQPNFLFNKKYEIRTIFNNFYFLICQLQPQIKNQYYSINLEDQQQKLKNANSNEQYRYWQFFNTLNKILRLETSENQFKIYSNVSKTIQKSMKHLFADSSMKDESKQDLGSLMVYKEDKKQSEDILFGRLMILDSMKVYQPDLEITQPEEWIGKLISEPHANATKSIVYRIAQNLCSVKFNLSMLSKMMEGIKINKNSQPRNSTHMGLFNLGCICYINSTIQQLFMIQPFRQGIIKTYLHDSDPSSYFYQFQYLIYQLAFGKREFFIPDQFCLTYTDFQNKPVDIRQQHDADQFLNSLFDRLENTLKSVDNLAPQCAHLIRNNFCGELASVITCQSCFNRKMKIQDFYVLTLEIKNNKNLTQCFEKLTQPQVITDYYCENCDRKVQVIQKQIKIKKLPKFLFIHLQRLVFDLDSLSKIKLQHLIEYPQELDLSDFFVNDDMSEQDKTMFRLKGFIVHIGTSESGHYYSLIREGEKWIKFDDSRVDQWKQTNYSRQKQGTYLLIYEKVEKTFQKQNQLKKASDVLEIGNKQLMQKVKQDNLMLVKQTIFLQKSFARHLLQTLSRIDIPYELLNSSPNQLQTPFNPDHHKLSQQQKSLYLQAHNIILNYLRLVAQTKSNGVGYYEFSPEEIKNATCYLILLYHICPQLVTEGTNQLFKIHDNKLNTEYLRVMLVHNDKTIRQAYKLIFTKIMSILTAFTEQQFHSYLIPAPPNSQLFLVQKILQYLIGSLYDASKNYSKMQQHFEFMSLVAQMSQKAAFWLQQQALGPKLIHFICGDQTPMKGQLPSYNYLNPKKTQAMVMISKMICKSVQIWQIKRNHKNNQDTLNLKAYCQTKWYTKIYQSRYDPHHTNHALSLLASNNEELSKKLCHLITQKLNRFNHSDEYILAYVNLLKNILSIDDKYTIQRCENVLGVPRIFVDVGDVIDAKSTRYYKYWVNQFTSNDEIILPVLQLLFINRLQTNYFTLGTVTAILRLIVNSKQVQKYISQIPGPVPHQHYTDWIQVQLKNGLKQQHVLSYLDKKNVLNQIAYLLNVIEQRRADQVQDQMQQMQNNRRQQQNIMKQQNNDKPIQIQKIQIKKIADNQNNSYYRLHGQIKQISIKDKDIANQKLTSKVQGVYQCQCVEMEDQKGIKLLKYTFKIEETVRQAILKYIQSNYNYSFGVHCREFEIVTPYPGELNDKDRVDIMELFKLVVVEKKQPQVMKQADKDKDRNMDKDKDRNMHGQAPVIVIQDVTDSMAQAPSDSHQQIFECPFCTSISFSFSSRCPTCGQEWGEMM